MSAEVLLIMGVLGLVAVGASVAYWREATLAALLLVVFEGALRKWALPGSQAALYLAKDVILFGAYLGFVMAKGLAVPAPQARPFLVLLLMAAAYGVVEMFNPAMPSLTLAAVGWRAYFFYVPLIFIVPHLFSSQAHLVRALEKFALVALPVAALGVVQFYSPMDSAINTSVQHDTAGSSSAAIGFGEVQRARVAGTFSFITGYAIYLQTVAVLIGALLSIRGWSFRGNWHLYGTLVLVIAAMFATGSRGPVVAVIVISALFAVFASLRGDLSVGTAIRACIGALLLGLAVWHFIPEPAEAFHHRVTSGDDALDRVVLPFIEPWVILGEAGIGGYGIGAAHQSANFLLDSQYSWWTNGLVVEAESSKIMLELGILGFAMVYLFRIAIALAALRSAFALRSRPARTLALVISLFLGLQVIGVVVFNPTLNVFYWFAVGMYFALLRFEAHEVQLARRQAGEGRRYRVGDGRRIGNA